MSAQTNQAVPASFLLLGGSLVADNNRQQRILFCKVVSHGVPDDAADDLVIFLAGLGERMEQPATIVVTSILPMRRALPGKADFS